MFIWARPPFLRPQFFVWQGWSPDKWGSLIGVITYFRNQNANFRRDRPAWIRTGHHSVPTIHCSSIRWLHTANIPDTRNRVTSMPWSFRILNDQDKSWVYYQGIGGTKLRFGPDVENLTIEWVHETATRFVSDTLRGLRV